MDFLKSIHNDCHVCISEINLSIKVEKKNQPKVVLYFCLYPNFLHICHFPNF